MEIRISPKYGTIYWVLKVPNRSFILIHWGNLAGDKMLGHISHSAGCLLWGKYFGKLNGQLAVLYSRPTVFAFMEHMEYKPFKLNILEEFGGV